jgi:hypothetical protein
MLSKRTSARTPNASAPRTGVAMPASRLDATLSPQSRSAPALVAEAFLAAARHSGYRDVTAAIAELVDNSIQASATIVEVEMAVVGDDARVHVLDNGRGMSSLPLRAALQFGGSERFNDRSGLGRFGMGLPGGSLSQARTVDVYSWTNAARVLRASLALEAPNNRAVISQPRVARLPDWMRRAPSPTGTLVVWRHCDRLAGRDCASIAERLCRDLGRIYREWLARGLVIRVNGTDVVSINPLFPLGPSGTTAIGYGDVLKFAIRQPGSAVSPVEVRFTELPVARWGHLSTDQKRAIGVLRGATVSVVRAGREIDRGWILMGGKRRENYDDWWRCEIRFDPTLDEMFGVTNNKQGVAPTHMLRTILEPELEMIARQLNSRVRRAFQALRGSANGPAKRLNRGDRHLPPVPGDSGKGNRDYVFRAQPLASGSFYDVERRDKTMVIILNTGHPLYRVLYTSRRRRPSEARIVEQIVAAAARAELEARTKAEWKILKRHREAWGDAVAAFLGVA